MTLNGPISFKIIFFFFEDNPLISPQGVCTQSQPCVCEPIYFSCLCFCYCYFDFVQFLFGERTRRNLLDSVSGTRLIDNNVMIIRVLIRRITFVSN